MTLYRQIILLLAIILFIILFLSFLIIHMNYINTTDADYYEYLHPTLIGKFFGLYLGGLILIVIALRLLFRPLNRICLQATAILNNQYKTQSEIPKAPDLKLVGQAMNTMITQFDQKLDEDIFLTEQLHQQIYQDPVTKLGNRRYFDIRRKMLMSQRVKFGALLLVEFQGIKQYNEEQGYLKGNELIYKIGDVIKINSQDIKEFFLARIGGTTFAIFAPHLSDEEIVHLSTCLIHAIEELLGSQEETKVITAHIGIAALAGINNATQLLTFADIALKEAQNKGPFNFSQYKNEDDSMSQEPSKNSKEWKTYIDQIINDDLVTVVYQPVINIKNQSIMSQEALLRVKGADSNLIEARYIIPMADRYGLTYALDRCVIHQVLAQVKATKTSIPYVINLSACTLSHEPTLQWLFKIFSSGEYRDKIIVELGEYAILTHLPTLKKTLELLKQYGIGFGIEHFGYDFTGFNYLKNLKPIYLKIDGSYISDLSNQNTQFFISILTKAAHALGIQVMAECVESESQWNILKSFNVDGGQGKFLASPEDPIK